MAATISQWYHAQYAGWNRTRRLHTAPFVATETRGPVATAARLAATDALLLNMSDVTNLMASSSALQPEAPKKPDTLFGPGVGVISSGPEWTELKPSYQDELTPEVVKTWMTKSKETAQPTTTLQALVNLKRPTIKLSPLANADESTEQIHHQRHALEFEFDCDAPKCSIKMHVISSSEVDKELVFETAVEGGFGRLLKLSDGAILDLEHFEIKPERESQINQGSPSIDTLSPNTGNPEAQSLSLTAQSGRHRKRFSNFPFRKRAGHTERVSGPALQVVDADAPPASATSTADGSKPTQVAEAKAKEEGGVKITIKLEAWTEDSQPLTSVNTQITYLHIVRLGPEPAEGEEDKRPWVVRVVRREATIGLHTFHLHEIYGLSSSSSQPSTSVASEAGHAYPPPVSHGMEDQTSECLLCLSSPREVVLLPCRHLVACKECAVNMVEFGAGGTLVHTDEPTPTTPAQPTDPTATTTITEANGTIPTGDQAPTPATPTPQLPTPRRKRKAKGWFCPVCRQPYTSLLRITATPPEKEMKETSSSQENLMAPTQVSAPVVVAPTVNASTTESRSLFGRPNFLRSLSRSGNRSSTDGGSMV